MEGKRLNSKNNFINEKKTVSGVTKLPPPHLRYARVNNNSECNKA